MGQEQVMERHKRLLREGWVRRFTANEPRLSEMKDLYESMGLEVRVEAAVPEEGQECRDCLDQAAAADLYKTLYTRTGASDASPDDLFD